MIFTSGFLPCLGINTNRRRQRNEQRQCLKKKKERLIALKVTVGERGPSSSRKHTAVNEEVPSERQKIANFHTQSGTREIIKGQPVLESEPEKNTTVSKLELYSKRSHT